MVFYFDVICWLELTGHTVNMHCFIFGCTNKSLYKAYTYYKHNANKHNGTHGAIKVNYDIIDMKIYLIKLGST